jgi:hypothetical protein
MISMKFSLPVSPRRRLDEPVKERTHQIVGGLETAARNHSFPSQTLWRKAMTISLNNGNAQRKTLATQLDRLDVILDGLSDALSGSVEMAVRDVVGQVVRETVEATIREVLGNQDLLRATLAAQSLLPEPLPLPTPLPRRRTLKELLQGVSRYGYEKAKQATVQVSSGLKRVLQWGLGKLSQGCASVVQAGRSVLDACRKVPATVVVVGHTLWMFRKTTSIALAVGLLAGLGSYFAGPVIASIASGLSGAALAVSAMVLVPLWRMLTGNDNV